MADLPLQAQRLPASHGWRWITQGFSLWRRSPRTFLLLAPCFVMLMLLTWSFSWGPLLGMLLMLPLQIWVYLLCRAVDQNLVAKGMARPRKIRIHLKGLLWLWLYAVIASLVLGFIATQLADALFGVVPPELANIADVEQASEAAAKYSSVFLGHMAIAALIGALPVQAAIWFAPILSGLCNIPAFKSMAFSIIACCRNVLPFIVFMVAAIGISYASTFIAVAAFAMSPVIGTVMMFLALILTMSILPCAAYFSVKEIFGDLGARAEVGFDA